MKDITGQIKGGLKYISPLGKTDSGRNAIRLCECVACGRQIEASANRSERYKSCGCLKNNGYTREPGSKEQKRIYTIWRAMHSRCYNPRHKCYSRYGGRGVVVDPEWHGKAGFERFETWAYANGYYENPEPQKRSNSASIDRINSDGPYSPTNCRWITLGENADKARKERTERINKNKFIAIGGNKHGNNN